MRRHAATRRRRRAGYLTPALAMAILAAFLVAALILNVGWHRAAERQIAVAADAAALAAAAELACDERLLDGPLPAEAIERVRNRASGLAARHAVLGTPSYPTPGGIRFGQRVGGADGSAQLVETDFQPTTVEVTVGRGRDGALPWLFRAGGHSNARLIATAEAGIESHVAALKPRGNGTVPIWPLALRSGDRGQSAKAASTPAWADQIDAKLGGDRYGYDHESRRIVEQPDGLPELVTQTLRAGDEAEKVGITLVDVGQTFGTARLDRAMRDGLGVDDLAHFDGAVPIAELSSQSVTVEALPRLPIEVERNLKPGDARAIFLFGELTQTGEDFQTQINGVVVARLMDLRPVEGGWQATFQPAVLATGTAVLADAGDAEVPENRYLYKIRLTR